jgi:hypothetical protein
VIVAYSCKDTREEGDVCQWVQRMLSPGNTLTSSAEEACSLISIKQLLRACDEP